MSPDQIEINAMENIVLAETKDHADWELLGHIAHRSEDSKLSELLKPAVSEVEGQEDEHLQWTKTKMGELALKALEKNGHRKGDGKPSNCPEATIDEGRGECYSSAPAFSCPRSFPLRDVLLQTLEAFLRPDLFDR